MTGQKPSQKKKASRTPRRLSRWYEYPPFIDQKHKITYILECGHERKSHYDRQWKSGSWWCEICPGSRKAVARRQGW